MHSIFKKLPFECYIKIRDFTLTNSIVEEIKMHKYVPEEWLLQLESDLDDLCESRLELECEHSELLNNGFENSFFGGRQYVNYDEMLEAHETYLNQINILNNQIGRLKHQIDFFKKKVKFSPSYVLYNVKHLLNNSEKNLSIYADFL